MKDNVKLFEINKDFKVDLNNEVEIKKAAEKILNKFEEYDWSDYQTEKFVTLYQWEKLFEHTTKDYPELTKTYIEAIVENKVDVSTTVQSEEDTPLGLVIASKLACVDVKYFALFIDYCHLVDWNHATFDEMEYMHDVIDAWPWDISLKLLALHCFEFSNQFSPEWIADIYFANKAFAPLIDPFLEEYSKRIPCYTFWKQIKKWRDVCESHLHILEDILEKTFPQIDKELLFFRYRVAVSNHVVPNEEILCADEKDWDEIIAKYDFQILGPEK